MGEICNYLGYKETMLKAYYLNSNWMVFVRYHLDLAKDLEKDANLKVRYF